MARSSSELPTGPHLEPERPSDGATRAKPCPPPSCVSAVSHGPILALPGAGHKIPVPAGQRHYSPRDSDTLQLGRDTSGRPAQVLNGLNWFEFA